MATSMTDHPAAAPAPPKQSGGGGTILLLLVGAAAVGGGAWLLTHRGQGPVAAPAAGQQCGPCPYSNPADIFYHCALGGQGQTPTNSVDQLVLDRVAYLANSGQVSVAQINAGFIPRACEVCWDRLPTGCSNPGCS